MPNADRAIARDCQVFVTLFAGLAALFTVGCDECDRYGQTRCDGNQVQECIDDGDAFVHFYWTNRDSCAVACHESGGSAQCVDSQRPVPECAAEPNGAMCLNGVPSLCWDGYLSQGKACDAPTHCVVSDACGAICAVEDIPEPRCPLADPAFGPITYFCDGSETLVSCTCKLVVNRISCAPGGSCQEATSGARCH